MNLPPLYAIIDRETLDARGWSVAWIAHELAGAGVTLAQYRDKRGSPQRILDAAAEITQAFQGTACQLVMNDRADLALLAGWRGLHVGQDDLPCGAARRLMGHDAFLGVSTHTDEQVRAASATAASYVAVGPVFATESKANAEPAIGLEGVRRARALTSKPLVAIGGIRAATARSVIDAGADSVAVIGALLAAGKRPRDAAAELFRCLR